MTVIIYTYPPDYLMAGISARMLALEQGLHVVLAIDKNDPPLACEFATVVRTSFERKGNLNGRDFILGHLRLMAEQATGDYTGKLDSDTALLDARRLLRGRNESAVGLWVDGMDGMNGCCYFLKTADLPAMIDEAEKIDGECFFMEDRTTGLIASAVGDPFFYRWSAPGNLYDRFASGSSNGWFRENKAVVCFEARDDSDRRKMASDMKRLYHQP